MNRYKNGWWTDGERDRPQTGRDTERVTVKSGISLELAGVHTCSTPSSSVSGVSEATRAAVKRRMFGYLSASASSALALNA